MRHLTLVGDASVLPHSTRRWIDSEKKFVRMEVVPTASADFGALLPGVHPATLAGRLTAIDEQGNLWYDGAAELLVLWALRRYRARALAIGHPSRLPFRSHNLDWAAGGEGRAWEERSEHVGCGESR